MRLRDEIQASGCFTPFLFLLGRPCFSYCSWSEREILYTLRTLHPEKHRLNLLYHPDGSTCAVMTLLLASPFFETTDQYCVAASVLMRNLVSS